MIVGREIFKHSKGDNISLPNINGKELTVALVSNDIDGLNGQTYMCASILGHDVSMIQEATITLIPYVGRS